MSFNKCHSDPQIDEYVRNGAIVRVTLFDGSTYTGEIVNEKYSARYGVGHTYFYKTHIKKIEVISNEEVNLE